MSEEKRIEGFWREYEFLSNFYPSPIEYEEMRFPTVEHAFQAAKSLDLATRERFTRYPTPGAAKRAGRRLELRPDWDKVRIGIMGELIALKFAPGTALCHKLLATGGATLVEENWWRDRFWGTTNGIGENWLGRLLMSRRAELSEIWGTIGFDVIPGETRGRVK